MQPLWTAFIRYLGQQLYHCLIIYDFGQKKQKDIISKKMTQIDVVIDVIDANQESTAKSRGKI